MAVGSSSARGGIVRALGDMGIAVAFPNLVDPAAVVAHHIAAMQPRGLVAFPFSLVSDRVVTGEHCHVNTGAVVGHEVTLGDYVTISPRAVWF